MSPVFDEAKYRALLEKLEVSEVNLLSIRNKNFDFRIDSEYFFKEHLALDSLLDCKRVDALSNLSYKISDGTHFTPEYVSSGVPFLSAINVQKNILDLDRGHQFITLQEHNNLYKRCDPKSGDILLRKVGVGERLACVVPQMYFEFSIFVSVALVRPKTINPFFLSTFINSCYGQKQLLRFNKGIGQPDLHLEDIARLRVIIPSVEFQAAIEKICKQGTNCFTNSKNIYADAEHLLLQDLGLTAWQPDDESVATKTFADFQNSGRLDAEYYQPKYDDLFKRISSYDKSRLGDIVNITKSIEPGSEAYQEDGVPFVRVSDITKFGITSPEIHLDRDKYYSENLTPKKDTILLSKDGSVGIAYKVENDLDVITSGALLHLTVKNNDFLPDYLTLVLNSIVVRLQAERDAGGSIIQHWKPSEIENVIIPKLPMAIQEQIASKVQESFALRKESKRLLDLAKHAVEVAIEQGEEAAMKLLNSNI